MSETKNDFSAIRIGTRIRHAADGAIGRIVWANATTVKVQWDDGEKVNWKRAELAEKGLEILDDEQAAEPSEAQPTTPDEQPAPVATEQTKPATAEEAPAEAPIPETAPTVEVAATEQAIEQPAESTNKRRPRTTPAEGTKKTSAIDAAAKVLAEEGKPMGCKELIGAMAVKGYWTSPGGKTPSATLYSAILREIDTKGDAARFVKTGRGTFALRPQA
jgi:outer membrane biosynthesis protein TonB